AGAVGCDVEVALEGGPFDLVVWAADGLAVGPQDLPLPVDVLRPAEDVRRVRVPGDEAQGLLLATAADHDRDARPRDRLRRVEQVGRLVDAALQTLARTLLALEHLLRDLECLLEHLEAHAERREVESEPHGFLLVPGGAEAQPGTAAGQHVERRRGLDPDARMPVVDAADHQSDARPFRVGADESEGRPALEHRLVDRAHAPDLEEVVHDPDRIEADIVGGPDDPLEVPRQRRCPARKGERGDLQAKLHASSPLADRWSSWWSPQRTPTPTNRCRVNGTGPLIRA